MAKDAPRRGAWIAKDSWGRQAALTTHNSHVVEPIASLAGSASNYLHFLFGVNPEECDQFRALGISPEAETSLTLSVQEITTLTLSEPRCPRVVHKRTWLGETFVISRNRSRDANARRIALGESARQNKTSTGQLIHQQPPRVPKPATVNVSLSPVPLAAASPRYLTGCSPRAQRRPRPPAGQHPAGTPKSRRGKGGRGDGYPGPIQYQHQLR